MKDLELIKKHYGEQFSHLCRTLFPSILENEGLLYKLITKSFEPNNCLYKDILPFQDDFKSFIFSKINVEKKEMEIKTTKSPKEIMFDAGYILFDECKSEEDIQKFKKYYKEDEQLCTFRGGRLDSCRVWFAVKKNVNEIKREDFSSPTRQDEYGTSVISIQFSKRNPSTLSIKNRYNHTVNNPDATFINNLDNIAEGLTESFAETYGVMSQNTNNNFELSGYVIASDGKYYRYNNEVDNVCYCPNNVIIDNGEPKHYDKSRYLIVDWYIFDMQSKQIFLYNNNATQENDSFIKSIGEILKIEVSKGENKERVISVFTPKGVCEITIDKNNTMVKYNNPYVENVGNYFLASNNITELNLPNLKTVGDRFLEQNKNITELNLPKLEKTGDCFLQRNRDLTEFNLPNLKTAGDSFLYNNKNIKELNLPNLEAVGHWFLDLNEKLKKLDLPKVEMVGNRFLEQNESITALNLPNLKTAGDGFLYYNTDLKELNLPKLKTVGDEFLERNTNITELNLPNLEAVGHSFLQYNADLKELNLPNLKIVKRWFLKYNKNITRLNLLKLEKAGDSFLQCNINLKKLNLPNLETVGGNFLEQNKNIKELNLPNLKTVGDSFLYNNKNIIELNLPNLEAVGHSFLQYNANIKELNLPNLKTVGHWFLELNEELKELNLPNLKTVGHGFLDLNEKLKKLNLPKLNRNDESILPKTLRDLLKKQENSQNKKTMDQ